MSKREYIERRCIPVPFVGCWMWLLSCGSHGYGNAFDGLTVVVAHRLSYEAFKGSIPPGMLVQHSCDNKWCVNPDHLSLGTDKTNSDDKHRKGRANLDIRVFRPRADRKLTDEQAAEVRSSSVAQRALAAQYGVTQRVIGAIKAGRTYRLPAQPQPQNTNESAIDLVRKSQ